MAPVRIDTPPERSSSTRTGPTIQRPHELVAVSQALHHHSVSVVTFNIELYGRNIIMHSSNVSSGFAIRRFDQSQLSRKKAACLRKETGNDNYVSQSTQGQTPENLFRRAIFRSIKMLFRSPIVFFVPLEVSLVYGYLYLLSITFTFVFRGQYGFESQAVGLAHLCFEVGFLLGLFNRGATSDHIAKKRAAGTAIKPRDRLPPLIFGVVLVPLSGALDGAPIVGTSLVGPGVLFVFMPVQSYLSLFGAVLPLAGQPMYAALGLGWGNSLLAFVALATVPLTHLLMICGKD
ncbi:hypothetical protein QBC33DRAFT_618460 [Phialemonium atrogriseum]|uniref:Uncharacterized protein n=1 Tax=Phialemonium atrogriseum TaxID=1093897 RepID=A0AAJ0C2H3_9PEZI|nr:uncharacterized protein QBC33DRAFT_618460 [Phialemonium atrogriseum]KAK1768939.1 hypothetical protein QBC33DRAFT_618460 [Phialemonium atrogriseum]